jgi:hypothetical protein
MSTDDSVNIAKKLGCRVQPFYSNGQDEFLHQTMRNNLWKNQIKKWIIFCDMDEWLYINEQDLINEDRNGTTILSIKGYNVFGDSKKEDCSDINLHHLATGYSDKKFDKNICFKSTSIKEMNYSVGGHSCNPIGNIKFSNNNYVLKHLDYPGLPFKLNKQKNRLVRSENSRKMGLDRHYETPLQTIIDKHPYKLANVEHFYDLIKSYM